MKYAIALAAILIAAAPAMAQYNQEQRDWDNQQAQFHQQMQIDQLRFDQQRARENYQMDQLNAWTRGEPSSYGQGTLYR